MKTFNEFQKEYNKNHFYNKDQSLAEYIYEQWENTEIICIDEGIDPDGSKPNYLSIPKNLDIEGKIASWNNALIDSNYKYEKSLTQYIIDSSTAEEIEIVTYYE